MGLISLNEFQSPIEKYREDLPEEAYKNILSAIDNYKYIRNFIAADRPRIKDLPKSEDGRIEVNLSNPHILENMDYFRQPAIYFQKHKKYTESLPSLHKRSAWATFWKDEALKCLTIATNPETGEWIPGDFYFYLNYCPIMRVLKDDKGQAIDRVFDFPDVYDGDYLYYHYLYQARHYRNTFISGEHGAAIKCRGRGYSFKGGEMLAKRFMLGDSVNAQQKVRSLALASEKEYLVKDGILNKFVDIVTHCADHTGWGKSINKNSWNSMEWHFAYTTKDGLERGRKNEVIGVSMKDNPGKARGKRANLILYEEFGKFPNLLEAFRTNRPSTEAGPVAFGQCVLFGTGGEMGSSFQGAEELIYHPEGYRVHAVPNIYDRGTDGTSKCVFFSPEVLNLEGYYDKDGNSDIIGALAFIMHDRWQVKYFSADPQALPGHIAEHPISISEAIMRTGDNMFPVEDLKEHLENIRMQGNKFFDSHYVGDLILDQNGTVKWQVSTTKTPIRKFPHSKDNIEGAIEIFEMPAIGSGGVPQANRYCLAVDPYDDDTGTSLGSMFMFDFLLDTIVAEYTGRPKFADDFYEIARRLTLFYNARVMYENNRKGLFIYFSNNGATHLLMDTPQFLKDQHMVKVVSVGNKQKGIHMDDKIKPLATGYQRKWLLTPANTYYQDFDEAGNQTSYKLALHTIRSVAYLEELINYNSEGNFDRYSAMNMAMMAREEVTKYLDSIKRQSDPVKDIVNSDYFKKNYDDKMKRFSYKELLDMSNRYLKK